MRNVAETGTNRPYVMRKDSLCDALPNHPYVTLPEQRYPVNTYARGYHGSTGGALLKGGTSNGSQAIPTAQINSLAALKMGKMGSHQMEWVRRSYGGSSQENLAGGSGSLLHLYENDKHWSDDRRFVNSSAEHSSGVHLPMVYHLSGEGNTTMGGRRVGLSARGEQPSVRSVSELAHHNQRFQKVKESHGGYFPRGMEHTKRAPLMNTHFLGSSEGSIRREVLPSWWDQRGVENPSGDGSNGYPLPGVQYNKVGLSPKGMTGVVLVPLNRETRNGFTKWDQNGKEVDAGLVHKWSSGQMSRTSEYSYKDVEPVTYGSCYPDDASVESLPRDCFPWGSNDGFLHGKGKNHCESGGQWYNQSAVRRLSGGSLQRGVTNSWDEGGYTDGLESLDSIRPEGVVVHSLGKPTDGVTSLANEEASREEDATHLSQCTYNKSDFTEWVSHNRLLKNIISSHNGDGNVEKNGLYSLLFDAYGKNKVTFRRYDQGGDNPSVEEQIGQVVQEIGKDKTEDKNKDTERKGRRSNAVVEKIIFLKYLFNQYAHTEYPNFISFKCFKKMFETYKNVFSSEKIILFIFNCLDRCRRYYVSESDFLIGMLACSPHMENDITKDTGRLRHQLIFRAYDLDRDGYWSREEVFVFLYHLYELSKRGKHVELKGNKKKMKKFVAAERDKLMNKHEKISYDHFYQLVLDGKVEGTENLLRSNCDVATVVKTYFLYTYSGGSIVITSVDAGDANTTNAASVPMDGGKCEQGEDSLDQVEGTQLKGDNTQKCISAEFSAESTTGDPNSEEHPHISATSNKGEDESPGSEGDPEELVQKKTVDVTSSSNSIQKEKSEEQVAEQQQEQSEEQPQGEGEAVVGEEPPCGHSNENPKGNDLNSAGKKDEEVVEGEEQKVEECVVPKGEVENSEANAQESVPPGEKPDKANLTENLPHFGGGQEEERSTRIHPERSWKSCVEKIKEIVKAYRKRYLTDRTRLFGLNQDIAFKIFTAFYKVSYKRKREKYIRQFDHLCTGACTYNDILLLCDEAVKVFKGEDSIEKVDLPCKVFGDLHGNIFDLLDFFNMYNWPLHGETNEWLTVEEVATTDGMSIPMGKPNETLPHMVRQDNDVKYVFLGNYINRGKHSLEVICLLLSLKVLFPKHIYLLRGNHEERLFNYVHGFYADIEKKMERNIRKAGLIRYQGEVIQAHAYELFNRINDALEFLPLSVLVGGNILCVHAGIGDSLDNVEDFADVHKPIVVPQFVDRTSNGAYERVQKIIIDTLWSDPINYDDEQDMLLLEKVKPGEDIIPSSRGNITLKFGQQRLSSFLKRNKLKMVIRGHECVQEGYRYGYNRRLLTLFSATNYCNRHGNDAANAFIVKRGKSIVIFNQILKCPQGGQLNHVEERATGPVESPHELNMNRNVHNDVAPSEVPPLGVDHCRSGSPFCKIDQIEDASTDRMGSQPKITMSKVPYNVRTIGGQEEEEAESEELPCRKVDEEVTPFDPNEEFKSNGDAVQRKDNFQSNHILKDSHPIVKRKLRDTRSNEDMNWGVAVQLEGREGANRKDGRDGDCDGGHFLSDDHNNISDDHSNGDGGDDHFEGGPLRKSVSTNGTFSSEEDLYGGCSHGSSGRNYTVEKLSSKQYHFKGEGLEKAQNKQKSKSHLGVDAYWEGEYLYEDYQQCLDNLSHGDALKNPPFDEPASSDEFPCEGETKQDSRVNTNAIIEKFFQNGGIGDHGIGVHIYSDHLEDKEVERGGNLNHSQCAKLTPLSKRTNGGNVLTGDGEDQWGKSGNCANLIDELMSKPMDYMMMPPDLGVVNRPKLRRDTHSKQSKEHGSATLRSLRSLKSENNTSEPLTKLQMQCLPPDPKPQTKISLQKIIDKLEDDV
ncbi:Serine/threonine-protein phosphatase [Plasmodium coatneyi]|uniref:Serine/threonine-protein phosphatase n=1 Tax=Plasmodium coatneyi TaxID=208452 RepID=A0A1B1DWS3_9APIC|nr:Serine/threonine-protein phosphatase [Plasmodium coatneyi]ANQ07200.1 Serine/threonine-protein phosphatase [Plasmodium coatneyi]